MQDAMPPLPEVKLNEIKINKDSIVTIDYSYKIDKVSSIELS